MDKNVSGLSLVLSAAIGFASLPGSTAAAPSICDAISGNLVVNCGFEDRSLRGWTQSGNTGFSLVLGPVSLDGLINSPNSGDRFVALGPVGPDGFLGKTFSDRGGKHGAPG